MQSQHPIPQNVTQYQFRLVGDMTLKQFLELGGGFLLAYIVYSSNLIFFIKYPLAILSFLLGLGLAFFPLEDRPLDTWIINFLRAIYRPTRFIWKKSHTVPTFFDYSQGKDLVVEGRSKTIKAPSLRSIAEEEELPLTPVELERLKSIDSLYVPVDKPQEVTKLAEKPDVAVRKLHSQEATTQVHAVTVVTKPSPVLMPTSPALIPTPSVPEPPSISKPIFTHKPISQQVVAEEIKLPATPQIPNVVSGLILNESGKLCEGAIVQIVDKSGIPQRAIKTNVLGQFMITTPLQSGSYTIEVELDNSTFPITPLELNDKICRPIQIRAKV